MPNYTIAIHGGAGTILPEEMTPKAEAAYNNALNTALNGGYQILHNGGSAIDAVTQAVIVLEDNDLFNAGKGSVFAHDGSQELDAAIMDGKTKMAGAIAAVRNVRNPIELARYVMEKSDHVFLSGQGAIEFAKSQNIKFEPDEYFFAQFRYDQWRAIRDTDHYTLDHTHQELNALQKEKKFGTVGAVACDKDGNIAAATSTGGMTNKRFGRVGDSPIIGAGTYANNHTCAISATGHGEPFIRAVAAYDVSCLMEYKGLSLNEAMDIVVNKKLIDIQGEGGMIGVDAKGNVAMLFNSTGMYRGFINKDGKPEVAIYR